MGNLKLKIALPLIAACTASCGSLFTNAMDGRFRIPLLSIKKPYSAIGVPDLSFGIGGVLVIDGAARGGGPGGLDMICDMMIDEAGRIVVSGMSADTEGNYRMVLMRILPEGAPDMSFGSGGVAVSPLAGEEHAFGVSLAEDDQGRIVVGGNVSSGDRNSTVIWRYLPDGLPDEGFGGGGAVILATPTGWGSEGAFHCMDIAVGGEGGIAGTGVFQMHTDIIITSLFRLEGDGSPDMAFGEGGFVRVAEPEGVEGERIFSLGYSLVIDLNGQLVVAGTLMHGADNHDMAVWRFMADGSPDSSFGVNGTGLIDMTLDGAEFPSNELGLDIKLDGKGAAHLLGIRITTEGRGEMAIARLTPRGKSDRSFGAGGCVTLSSERNELGLSLAIDREGRVIVAGSSQNSSGDTDLALWRFLHDGKPDYMFGVDGKVYSDGAAREGVSGGRDILITGSNAFCYAPLLVMKEGEILAAGASQNLDGDYDMVVWKYR